MPKQETYLTVTGEIRYTMTNDYMFRAILQENEKVLRGLVSSLLHMCPEEIKEIHIENPIILGDAINRKNVVLDIHLKLNNNRFLNIEMQVLNEHDWPERSLFYLCRTFSQLDKGENYNTLLPTTHIGFLDFTLFPEHPEFFATYKLLNTKNYHLYSDKFILNVVNLNRIDLATDEDKAYQIDFWAKVFKITTWEELRMLAQNNEYVEEIVRTLYKCNTDEEIRKQCDLIEAEMTFNKWAERRREQMENEYLQMEKATLQLANKNAQLTDQNNQLTDQNNQLKEKIAKLEAEIKLKAPQA